MYLYYLETESRRFGFHTLSDILISPEQSHKSHPIIWAPFVWDREADGRYPPTMYPRLLALLALAVSSAVATNFNWEKVQLYRNETSGYADIEFGNTSGANSTYTGPKCKVAPGDAGWPTAAEWDKLNKTLGGALLKPPPIGSVCYAGAHYDERICSYYTSGDKIRDFIDHPLSTMTEWPGGSTCVVAKNPPAGRSCLQGGFPVYVVNASTVRHIQLAVNFARNRNLRLVVK